MHEEPCVSTLCRQTEIRRQRLIDRWIGLGKVRDKNSLTQTLSDWRGQQPTSSAAFIFHSATSSSWLLVAADTPYASVMLLSSFHCRRAFMLPGDSTAAEASIAATMLHADRRSTYAFRCFYSARWTRRFSAAIARQPTPLGREFVRPPLYVDTTERPPIFDNV